MNITFLFILFGYVAGMIFFKNLLNLNTKGYRLHAWQLIGWSLFLMVCFGLPANVLPHLMLLYPPVLFWMSPLIYFMLRSRPRKSYQQISHIWWHRAPTILSLIVLLPYLILDASDKLDLYRSKSVIITIMDWIWVVFASGYGIILIRKVSVKSDSRVFPLFVWCLFMCCMIIWFVSGFKHSLIPISGLLLLNLSTAYYIWTSDHHKSKGVSKAVPDLGVFMKTRQPYLDQDLNLSKLADLLDISVAQLSKWLNQEPYKSYNHYINKLRVQAAIHLLRNPDNNRYKLEALAHQSGFKSLTTFNAAFKKHTGKTPKQYRTLTES